MANKTIPQLPEQTGKTDNDLLAIVDSGETTTSKIKVSTLLSGLGGKFIAADGTNNIVPDYYPTTAINSSNSGCFIAGGTGNTIDIAPIPTYRYVIGGFNNDVQGNGNSGIIGGHTNTIDYGGGSDVIIAGNNNTISSDSYDRGIFAGRSNIISGGFGWMNVIVGGRSNFRNATQRGGMFVGYLNTSTGEESTIIGGKSHNGKSNQTSILGGLSNTIDTGSDKSVIIGGESNTISGHTRSAIIGGSGLTTSYDDEVVVKHLTVSGQSRDNWVFKGSASAFTLDFDEGNLQEISMSADTTLTLTNVKFGGRYSIKVYNEGTHAITGVSAAGFNILCEGGVIPNITNNGTDLCVLEVFGPDIMVRHFANFTTPE